MDTIIGIDLGTSTTEAAVYKDGKSIMILNFNGEAVTPSVVGIDDSGNYVIGSRARAQLLLQPDKTAIEIKRKMGTDAVIRLGRSRHTPVELSTRILSYVKNYAEEWLGEEIDRAVISVPAYFNDLQRQATVQAGKDAGFIVERIINEPTAAALSYGMEHLEEESHILVYDLGGGTFDVTLLEMFAGVLEVKASNGDNKLGGKDFDERLTDWLAEEFYKKHEIKLQEIPYAMVKLKEEAERCKIALSSLDSYEVRLPMIAEKDGVLLALEETVTKAQFETLIEEIVERTHVPIDVVLSDSGVSKDEIDLVLLVGGSTRVPFVQADIRDYLGQEPAALVNPDFAVAEGAAVQGAIISGELRSEDSLVMTDVCPYTLGIEVMSNCHPDCMSVIIPRNMTIPVTRSEIYSTSADMQEEADICIYQGESVVASRNNFLGRFRISGIPPAPMYQEKITVEFSYNLDGILSVTASLVSTGNKESLMVDMMEAQVKRDTQVDVSNWKAADGAGKYRTIIRRAERLLHNQEFKLFKEDVKELEEILYLLKVEIVEQRGNLEEAKLLEEEIMEFLDAMGNMPGNL